MLRRLPSDPEVARPALEGAALPARQRQPPAFPGCGITQPPARKAAEPEIVMGVHQVIPQQALAGLHKPNLDIGKVEARRNFLPDGLSRERLDAHANRVAHPARESQRKTHRPKSARTRSQKQKMSRKNSVGRPCLPPQPMSTSMLQTNGRGPPATLRSRRRPEHARTTPQHAWSGDRVIVSSGSVKALRERQARRPRPGPRLSEGGRQPSTSPLTNRLSPRHQAGIRG